jgi:hypothetical protein
MNKTIYITKKEIKECIKYYEKYLKKLKNSYPYELCKKMKVK